MKKTSRADLALDTAHYTPEIIEMMDNADKCLCCGKELKFTDKNKRRNRGYCSLDCYYAYPPKMAYITYTYGIPARQAILNLLNRNNNMQITAGLLGINRLQLHKYMEKLKIRRIVRYE